MGSKYISYVRTCDYKKFDGWVTIFSTYITIIDPLLSVMLFSSSYERMKPSSYRRRRVSNGLSVFSLFLYPYVMHTSLVNSKNIKNMLF